MLSNLYRGCSSRRAFVWQRCRVDDELLCCTQTIRIIVRLIVARIAKIGAHIRHAQNLRD